MMDEIQPIDSAETESSVDDDDESLEASEEEGDECRVCRGPAEEG